MIVHTKLSSSLEGALAAGGDPATSPLYVFGPFLAYIVPAGVAHVTFGPSIWLVVATVFTVSLMYSLVMRWVTDGTGGTGLSEEEFGPWAAKCNASITVIEYLLTFLVSIAALVTFLSDRIPALRREVGGIEGNLLVALGLTIVTVMLVNAGPRVAAATFGPATALVLLLLWAMVLSAVWRFGLRLPTFELRAFEPGFLDYTLGGYARILALMTGIEVFANIVPAFQGEPARQSRFAFRSLMIIMGSTAVTMLVVGPVILEVADPGNARVSVFTQTMDVLLPAPLSYVGTFIGVAVLLSAGATALQGIAYLGHGLDHRHYVPRWLARQNVQGIADRTVWTSAVVIGTCLAMFGRDEATYLALYAAGVFVLLSLTGWAATKRLWNARNGQQPGQWIAQFLGVFVAAALTSTAAVVIFEERFYEGAWLYLVLVPMLWAAMSTVRASRGAPSDSEDRLGRLAACACPGVVGRSCCCEKA